MELERFRIEVPDAVLDDLRERLGRTRWPDEIGGSGWEYGADLATLKSLVGYWLTSFDWREQEHRLNELPHYRAVIDGIGIHFVHERGRGPDPLPLILTHGWPGSFAEMLKILPLLADPGRNGGDASDAFDVVIPSIPGYGFSDRPTRRGMHTVRIAKLWRGLMNGLGYGRFGAQGGDWGASIATRLALGDPESVVGIHLNYIPGSYSPYLGPGAPELSAGETKFLEEKDRWGREEGAYGHLQGTRPQTPAFGLNDSPAGLAAWIVEKFRAWSDCDGEVERRFTKDELLTNVMIYWVTGTIASSIRLYLESRATPLQLARGERIRVPCGVAAFPREAPSPPREWVERGYDVRHWTVLPRGGHFAALEEPHLLAQDIQKFFRLLRATRNRDEIGGTGA